MHKLGVIVPYRNRPEQLQIFKDEIFKYFSINFDIPYVVIVVDQIDKKKFNRGKLLNIGFFEAKKQGCDYVVFHDIDMIPIDADYNYDSKPLQLANRFINDGDFTRVIQRNYFGGVTLFPVTDFEKINGYSNLYKGWGFEDDDLLLRCRENNLTLEYESYRTQNLKKLGLYLNGKDSYIKFHNIYRTIRPFSLIATFFPDPIDCNPSEITDEYTFFSIPGHDFNISYNSFSRYKVELFLKDNTPVSLTSDYMPNLPVQVVVNVDPKKKRLQFFINGKEVQNKNWGSGVMRLYEEEPYFFIGTSEPSRGIKSKFFKGYFINFGILHGELSQEQVRKIYLGDCNNRLIDSHPELSDRWNGYWDSLDFSREDGYTLKDSSTYNNNGWMNNCMPYQAFSSKVTRVKFPYRRKSIFKLLKHEEAGYTDGFWKDWSSRENQLRYYRRVNSNDSKFAEDGLSTCKFKIRAEHREDNFVKLDILT